MGQKILVWDMPTRIFHWSLAATFAAAWLTAEADQWQLVHLTCGYLFVALILFRLVWGIAGSRYARFASFLRGPSATIAYLRSYIGGKPQHFTGHNPLGAIAVVLMLALGIGIGITGWMALNDVGGESLEEIHGLLGNGMLVIVGIHIIGVIVSGHLHRENLVAAMITGNKTGAPEEGINKRHGVMALLLVAALGIFAWSLTQGKLPILWDPNNAHLVGGEHGEAGGDDKDGDDD